MFITSSAEAAVRRFTARGGWWVVGQGVLLGAVALVIALRPDRIQILDHRPIRLLGWLIAVGGLMMLWLGFRHLGASLTPYPTPLTDAVFVDHGIYARVRHPLYGGLILGSAGMSLAIASGAGLALTAALGVLLTGKSRWEEARLAARYPQYAEYRRRVRSRFIPWRL